MPQQPLSIVQHEPLTIAASEPDAAASSDTGIGALLKHYWSQVNPAAIAKVLPIPQALGGEGVDAPVKAVKNMLEAQGDLKYKGDEAWAKGDHIEAVRHYMDWLLPVVGPALDQAGNEAQEGKYAASLGDTLGLATSVLGPKAAQALKASSAADAVANAAEQGAQARAVDVMAPKVGPNKIRLGNQAAKVGTEVLQDTSAMTRGGMLDQAATKLSTAYDALDAAYDKVPDTRMYATAPVKAALQQQIKNLSVSGIGGSVEPATRAARIGSLRQALDEVSSLGSVMNLDNMRKLRIAWDEGAQSQFAPSVAADYLKARGQGAGYADARSALNDYITTQHPELSNLNADAHLWKTAVDVMQAAEESDRVRPTVGRSIMARGLGAAVGGATEGPMGAAVGAISGPVFERALANLAPTAKILVGRQMANLADAIRSGQASRVNSLVTVLKGTLATAAQQAGQRVNSASPALVPALANPGGAP